MNMIRGAILSRTTALALAVLTSVSALQLSANAYTYVPKTSGLTLLQDIGADTAQLGTEPFYSEVLSSLQKQGVKDGTGEPIVVDLNTAVSDKGTVTPKDGLFENQPNAAIEWIDTDMEWVEFQVTVPTEGFYNLEVGYHLYDQKVARAAERSVEINGVLPFNEAGAISFSRYFKDAAEPKVNAAGDEIQPTQEELKGWYTTLFTDAVGYYSEPLRFHFKEGVNKIRLSFVEGQMAISSIRLTAPQSYVDYEAYINAKKADNSLNQKPLDITQLDFQAEKTAVLKNDNSLNRVYNGEAGCIPRSVGKRLLNVMGGGVWKDGGQTITWEFDIKQAGYYKIGLRFLNDANDGISAYRTIRLDGEVPFSEMLAYSFPYSTKWQSEIIGKDAEKPYYFYLSEGKHTFSMTVTLGNLTELLQATYYDMMDFAELYRSITKITSSDPDPNHNYHLQDKIPNLKEQLLDLQERLQKKVEYVNQMGPQVPSMVNNLTYIIERLEKMVARPNNISRKLSDISDAQSTLGDVFVNLQYNTMTIDYFSLGGEKTEIKIRMANVFEAIWAGIEGFAVSFTKDYKNVGGGTVNKGTRVIRVWAGQGREWAELMKEMADESFTPKTNIMVQMNMMPAAALGTGTANVLVLAIASGNHPDVALGIDRNTPVEIAIRDGLYDVSKFEDYKEVQSRFVPNTEIPFRYQGGVYAIPETMDMRAFIYRTDIFEELGLTPPNTWDEMYEKILPVLYQNNMQCYIPQDFGTFLFQLGGRFYSEDGLTCVLDSAESIQAFEEYCGLFNNYNVPITANFYMRMRTGEMPCGIGSISEYRQLMVAAPEISGKWKIALVPGHVDETGTVNRSVLGITSTADVILSNTEEPEASWEFLKWWTSTETQIEFGSKIEVQMGASARWNSANLEAWKAMPWDTKDLAVMEQTWEWVNERPIVLGGYVLDRHVTNAWNRVVVSTSTPWTFTQVSTVAESPRESLEKAVEDINREMKNKQEEYGIKPQSE